MQLGKTASPESYQQINYQPPQPPGGVRMPAPVGDVTIEPLPTLGGAVISGTTPEDVEAIKKIIERLREISQQANLQLELIPLKVADATSVAVTLTELFRRVVVGPSGNTLSTGTRRTTTEQGGQQGQARRTTEEVLASVVLLPVPRLNAIFVAAPGTRMMEIKSELAKLDVMTSDVMKLVPIPLKRASAARLANQISALYDIRYPPETGVNNQVRVTFDESRNTIFVQAAPADMAEIKRLVDFVENSQSPAKSSVRVVKLRNALADQLATILLQTLGDVIAPTSGTGVPTGGATNQQGGFGQQGGQQGGRGGFGQQQGGQQQGGRGGFGQQQGGFGQQGTGNTGAASGIVTATSTLTTKTTTLQLQPSDPNEKPVQSGLLEDIHIVPDVRINSLIVTAPDESLAMILALIRELDVAPSARAELNVFRLERADATQTATMLQQLFLGGGGQTGQQGQVGQQGQQGLQQGVGTTGQVTPLQLSLGAQPPEGAPLIDLRITVDPRTNSILVAGSENDLLVIEAIVNRLEGSDAVQRRHEVYQLHNATAADVAAALNQFFTDSLAVIQRNVAFAAVPDLFLREVVIVPEAITNKLLISASPRYFSEVMETVLKLDVESPQVVLQVLIAEVNLTGNEEFGVELGLQSPVLFKRSVFPANGLLGNGTVSFANAEGGLIPPGVTVNGTVNPASQLGFNFNNPGLPLGNNVGVSPNLVGFQGLGSLGVGRISPTGVGGFVFSAASDSFSLLIRALKTQGRIDILSRPQVTATDNQSARVFVGQDFPIVLGSNVTATGIVSNNIDYRPVGIELLVTPKITPDGRVIMRVTPQVSSTSPTNVALGNGIFATAINQQIVDTTVIAHDGETVAIGGLITKRNQKQENKIPVLGDLPGVGTLFRYRTQSKIKQELLVILTPHIVRTPAEARRILAEEACRMDWLVGDVLKTHGTSGMEPIIAPHHYLDGACKDCPQPLFAPEKITPNVPGLPTPTVPPVPSGTPNPTPLPVSPNPVPQPGTGVSPMGQGQPIPPVPAGPQPGTGLPRPKNPPGSPPGVPRPIPSAPSGGAVPPTSFNMKPSPSLKVTEVRPASHVHPPRPSVRVTHIKAENLPSNLQVPTGTSQPVEQGKESPKWRLFPRNR